MLHRAASNAYSWWWASHIRTKQSKWLEQNLQDMEEKVGYTLKIIENDGDTFAHRAEMYYRKRPEIVNFVEESFRSYRALAERYDHLSRELQSANRTIASAFPEHAQFPLEEEEEDKKPKAVTIVSGEGKIPDVPEFPKLDFKKPNRLLSRKVTLRRNVTIKAVQTSGLTKSEALDEIDHLQKEILGLQTEKEFVRSSCERGYEKYWEIEGSITEMQKRVSSLQEEFGVGIFIEDHEARTLMAGTALKSCKETLTKLEEKHRQSDEDAKVEKGRIREAGEKFSTLKNELAIEETEPIEESTGNEQLDLEDLKEKIRAELAAESNPSFTVIQLAEKIDELVDKVVSLETAVSSQTAFVKSLTSETDVLNAHIRKLEEDKESLVSGSEELNNRIKDLEDELRRVKNLNEKVEEKSNKIQTHFAEATCSVDDLSTKLSQVKRDDDIETVTKSGGKLDNEDGEEDTETKDYDTYEEKSEEAPYDEKSEKKYSSDTEGGDEFEEQPDWRQLLGNNLEDREKILLEDYTSVLRSFGNVKRKLTDAEKKNRDGFYELAMQIRDLKNTVTYKDMEILSLRHKLDSSGKSSDHESDNQRESISYLSSGPVSDFSATSPYQHGDLKKPAKGSSSPNRPLSSVEERIRTDIDELLEENLEFWLRFSTAFHQIQKFQSSVQDLRSDVSKMNENTKMDGRPLYKHLREIRTELQLWLENNAVLKDELQARLSSLCNIQDEISRVTNAGPTEVDNELSEYQAAKFHGEVLNMKQENGKVSNELQTGLDRVMVLKAEVEKILEKLEADLGLSQTKSQQLTARSSSRTRIPLRSFLFGVKLKKKQQKASTLSLFSCVNPALQKQYSYIAPPPERIDQ